FYYLLKPRSTDVKKVPQVIFHYFDPAAGQDPSGYQTSLTDDIPLKVTPALDVPVEPTGAAGPAEGPHSVLGIQKGGQLVRRDRPWELAAPWLLGVLLVAPPLACVTGYVVGQRLPPAAARRTRQRRSRAARQALHDIRAARSLPPEKQAGRLAETVTLYLRDRLDLPASVP